MIFYLFNYYNPTKNAYINYTKKWAKPYIAYPIKFIMLLFLFCEIYEINYWSFAISCWIIYQISIEY